MRRPNAQRRLPLPRPLRGSARTSKHSSGRQDVITECVVFRDLPTHDERDHETDRLRLIASPPCRRWPDSQKWQAASVAVIPARHSLPRSEAHSAGAEIFLWKPPADDAGVERMESLERISQSPPYARFWRFAP
jgi:hypothetical protein